MHAEVSANREEEEEEKRKKEEKGGERFEMTNLASLLINRF